MDFLDKCLWRLPLEQMKSPCEWMEFSDCCEEFVPKTLEILFSRLPFFVPSDEASCG